MIKDEEEAIVRLRSTALDINEVADERYGKAYDPETNPFHFSVEIF